MANEISLDDVMPFGMPPKNFLSETNDMMKDTMPTATIYPCEPEFSNNLSLFAVKKSTDLYQDILKLHGFTLSRLPIEVAYLADNFPTDSFSNEYGETFLDKFSQVASGGLSDFTQILGVKTLTGVVDVAKSAFGKGSIGSKILGMGESAVGQMTSSLKNMAAKTGNEKAAAIASSMLDTANAVAAGARVDFPQVWKNSGFSPSYTMTIRLYNPVPGSVRMTRKYIVGPLAALLLLGLPRAGEANSATYQWPFLCQVRSKGIYHLDSAYINSIAVIKGGDQQNIAWNQSLGIVDVRIDFGSLYGSILVETSNKSAVSSARPTLKSYLEGMGGEGTKGFGKRQINSYLSRQTSDEDVSAARKLAAKVQESKRASDAYEERILVDAITSNDNLVASSDDTTTGWYANVGGVEDVSV